jgi:maltooligosyltrehalose trehalohydrolase
MLHDVKADGYGLDALWNDDFHHAAVVALTGRREAYYTDYRGTAQEFVSLTKWGFLFQGQRYKWQRARRGTPALGLAPQRFITFLENHDQIANAPSGRGERLHQSSHPAAYRAMTAFWLLSPGTPMFFQGQEFASTAPFFYFADHQGTLGESVAKGRGAFMQQFRSAEARRDFLRSLPNPTEGETFRRSVLNDDERLANRRAFEFHQDLLRLRRDDPVIGGRPFVDGAVLAEHAFVLRLWAVDPRDTGPSSSSSVSPGDRLLVVNFGGETILDPAPEPLLAPPRDRRWGIHWSSEDPMYGGGGTAPLDTYENWRLPAFTTVLLTPEPA